MIGFGDGINPEKLDRIAGGTGKAYIAKSSDELIGSEFVTMLTKKTCETGDHYSKLFLVLK